MILCCNYTTVVKRSTQDYISVPAAVDRLLTDIIAWLRQIKPDVMIEFRQSYVGR